MYGYKAITSIKPQLSEEDRICKIKNTPRLLPSLLANPLANCLPLLLNQLLLLLLLLNTAAAPAPNALPRAFSSPGEQSSVCTASTSASCTAPALPQVLLLLLLPALPWP